MARPDFNRKAAYVSSTNDIKPKYGLLKFTLKELKRLELAIRIDTPINKNDAKLLEKLQKKINMLIDIME